MNSEDTRIARRSALKLISSAVPLGLFGVAGSNPISAAAATPATPTLDLSSPKSRLRAFMMMRGALDDRLVIGFLSGRYYGIVDDEMTPLYGVVAATFSRYRLLLEGEHVGGYEMTSFEQAYFTDLDSGAVLTSWRNPYTDKTVTVPVTRSNPAKTIITPDLTFTHAAIPGFHAEHLVLPVEHSGDDVLFVEQTRVSVDRPAPAKPFRYNEIVSLRASAKDLNASDVKRVPCATTFSAVVGWRPWQEMGDRPGHLLAQGSGRYGVAIDALPKAWLDATQRLRPELIINPAQVMDALKENK